MKHQYTLHDPEDQWEGGYAYIHMDDGRELFEGIINRDHGGCCGIEEFHSFEFEREPEKFNQLKFNEHFSDLCKTIGEYHRIGYLHLTLTRKEGSEHPIQPSFFKAALDTYQGAIHSEWRRNPNTDNEVQFWILPV